MDLKKALEDSLRGIDSGFKARLAEINHTWNLPEVDVTGKFLYLNFKGNESTVEEFADFLYGKIASFCIPEKIRKDQMKKFDNDGDYRHLQLIFDKAKKLFVEKDPLLTTGEPGELILFVLLEVLFKAPIIACKMYLKTNHNVPVHGTDGIHVSYDNQRKKLQLFWGESKLNQSLPNALDRVCESLTSFLTYEKTQKPRDRDIHIIQDYISVDDDELKNELLKYFDPYEPESNDLEEYFACFVGFDFPILSNGNLDVSRIKEHFEEEYLIRIQTACQLMKEKIVKNNLHHLKFVFFLIPFNSIDELRIKFYEKLGIKNDKRISK